MDEATHAWDELAKQVEAFIEAWEQGGAPPDIAAYLPAEPAAVRRLILVELIKVDLEFRCQQNARVLLDDYCRQFPELMADGQLPSDLIYEEYHIRKSSGEVVDPLEYCQRFPAQADELRRLFELESPHEASGLLNIQDIHKQCGQFHAGQTLDDFDLILQLGRGAFAVVYLARQVSMQRIVALKISADKGTEPQTLAQLEHPHIVQVYDQRRIPDRRLRLLYMQFVAGGTLKQVIDRIRSIPLAERTGRVLLDVIDGCLQNAGQSRAAESAVRRTLALSPWPEVVCLLGTQLATALDFAHAKGVLHRDIKPANVLLAEDGTAKLADFNISFSSQLQGAAPAAYFGGSLAYMSPEQLEAFNPQHPRSADQLDARSDLFSLGVLLWELLYGSRPFRDELADGDWPAMLSEMTERRRAFTSDVHEADRDDVLSNLRATLQRCLSADPQQRFASGAELARALSLCLQPRMQQMLRIPRRGWRYWVQRMALPAVLIAALLPNIAAAVFNWNYNYLEIVKNRPDAWPAFVQVSYIVNGALFPLGVAAAIYLALPLARAMRALGPPTAGSRSHLTAANCTELPLDPPRLRRRALTLGQYAAVIGFLEWFIAGPIFPVAMNALAGQLGHGVYPRFFASMVLCGLVVSSYPFYFVNVLCVRVFYPTLLRCGPPSPDDEQLLERLGWWSGVYLFMAGCVPALSLALLVLIRSENSLALGVLSMLGAFGFALIFWLFRRIQQDLQTLLAAVQPLEFSATTAVILSDLQRVNESSAAKRMIPSARRVRHNVMN